MTFRDFHLPGRSPVYAREGMAATSHPLATVAAIDTLKAGGTAADAAVAAVAALCVVEPAMTGIGGDCFCLVAKPDAPVWGYNGSGRAGAAASAEKLRAKGVRHKIEATSPHAVTVPGAIEAWEAILKAHGRFGLDRALQPAIRHAEDGFPVAPRVADDWAGFAGKLAPHKGSAKYYLVNGRAPEVGHVMRLPALAATLKAIAQGGAKAFYEGEIAADIAATVQAAGGDLAAEDLARHKGDVVAPIGTNYRGLDIVELPPSGQGLTALVLLNILENFDLAKLDPSGAERYHLALEAARLAFGVRDTHIADPAFMRVPVPDLLDKGFAKKLSALLDPEQARAAAEGADAHERHDLHDGRRSRPHGGVDHQLALFAIRHRHLHREDRHHAAQSRHRLRGGARSSEHDRAQQAADAHHHPGARDARRPLRDAVRRDGCGLPADGPHAGGHEHRGLRHGRSAGDRCAARVLRG